MYKSYFLKSENNWIMDNIFNNLIFWYQQNKYIVHFELTLVITAFNIILTFPSDKAKWFDLQDK